MTSVEEMLKSGETRQAVLKTMPKRTLREREMVWSEGLARIQNRLAAATNRTADALIERVSGGAVKGLWYDPLDTVETYVKNELRLSRSREDGERRRQRWLMDVLMAIGGARATEAATLMDYPPAAALLDQAPEVGFATSP